MPKVLLIEIAPVIALLARDRRRSPSRRGPVMRYMQATAARAASARGLRRGRARRAAGRRTRRGGGRMSRLVPYPLLTAALILMWLLLNRFSAGHLLLGTAVALVAGKSMSALQPAKPRMRRWDLIPRLVGDRAPRHRPLEPRRGRADPDRRAPRAAPFRLRRDPARAARPDRARHPRGHRHRHAGHRLDAVRRPARRGAAACLRPRRRGRLDRA